jgi:hypothetical protein
MPDMLIAMAGRSTAEGGEGGCKAEQGAPEPAGKRKRESGGAPGSHQGAVHNAKSSKALATAAKKLGGESTTTDIKEVAAAAPSVPPGFVPCRNLGVPSPDFDSATACEGNSLPDHAQCQTQQGRRRRAQSEGGVAPTAAVDLGSGRPTAFEPPLPLAHAAARSSCSGGSSPTGGAWLALSSPPAGGHRAQEPSSCPPRLNFICPDSPFPDRPPGRARSASITRAPLAWSGDSPAPASLFRAVDGDCDAAAIDGSGADMFAAIT